MTQETPHTNNESLVDDVTTDKDVKDASETKPREPNKSIPAWIANIKPDNRVQPWRAHEGIEEDRSFSRGQDLILMAAAEYPGGSLAA